MLLLDVSAVAASAILAAGGAAAFSAASGSAPISDAPPLDAYGAQLVTKCARRAQHRRRHARAERTAQPQQAVEWTVMDGSGSLASDANESYLNGLPVRQARYDNVQRRGALFCRSGIWLEIGDKVPAAETLRSEKSRPDAQRLVRGVRADNSRFVLEFLAVAFGLVSIRGAVSRNFLCMDAHGELYAASPSNYSAQCVFMEEMLENHYNLYSSCAYGTRHRPWYVALHRSGHARKGRTTRKKHKSSHFVTYFEGGESGNRYDDKNYGSYEDGRTDRRRLRRRFSLSATQMLPRHLLSAHYRHTDPDDGQHTVHQARESKQKQYSDGEDKIDSIHRSDPIGDGDAKHRPNRTGHTVGTKHYAYHHDHYRFSIQMDLLLDDSSVVDEPPSVRPTHHHRSRYRNDNILDDSGLAANDSSRVNAYSLDTLFHGNAPHWEQAGDFARRQRLLREEKLRRRQKNELERLRKLALAHAVQNVQSQANQIAPKES